jgi:transcriptional regulator with XRE-family HTH domain
MAETIHIGRKISRIRELKGMKQDALAAELGISQQAISKIEQSEKLEGETLEKVAKVLGISPNAIESFSEEAAINYFNTFHDNSANNGAFYAHNFTFNPIDKLVELYERLLKSEQEKIELLKGKQ